MSIDAYVKFEHLNPRTNTWHAYPAGITVRLLDDDLFSSDDNLATTSTDANGTVHLHVSTVDASVADLFGSPDVYFKVHPNGARIDGVPLPKAWSSKNGRDTSGRSGFYRGFTGGDIGTASSPVVFRIPGINAWIEFYYYNEYAKRALPLPAGVPARMRDYDEDTADETLAVSVTNSDGLAVLTHHRDSVSQETYEGAPEIYFDVLTTGLNDNGTPLPPSQSTRRLRSNYGGSGYYSGFTGSEIAQYGHPRRFVLGPKHFTRVGFILLTADATDTSTPDFQAKVNKIRVIQEKFKEEYLYATYGRSLVVGSQGVAVIKMSGPIPDVDNAETFLKQVTAKYYSDHGDLYDHLVIYEDFAGASLGSRSYRIRNNVCNIGQSIYDNSAEYGSNRVLKTIGLVCDVNDLPAAYHFCDSKMHLLMHEGIGHQFGIYGLQSLGISDSIHFNQYCGGPSFSYMYAHPWRMTPDGRFYVVLPTADEFRDGFFVRFHPLVLYAMGLYSADEVGFTMVVTTNYKLRHRYDGPAQSSPAAGSALFRSMTEVMAAWGGPRSIA